MSVVKINAITVPADSGNELAHRFAARAHAVDDQPGFEGFELLAPTDGRHVWLVVTRWADEASYEAWAGSDSFRAGHPGGPGGCAAGAAARPDPGSAGAHSGPGGPGRVGLSAELWSFRPTVSSTPASSTPARAPAAGGPHPPL